MTGIKSVIANPVMLPMSKSKTKFTPFKKRTT